MAVLVTCKNLCYQLYARYLTGRKVFRLFEEEFFISSGVNITCSWFYSNFHFKKRTENDVIIIELSSLQLNYQAKQDSLKKEGES